MKKSAGMITNGSRSLTNYDIHTDIKYKPLERIDMDKLAGECQVPWWNQSLCTVNDCVARLGVFKGEFHWHKHEREDEIFIVLEGQFFIDLEGRTVELSKHQAMMVPRGVLHRTRSPERSVVLMVEAATIQPTGD